MYVIVVIGYALLSNIPPIASSTPHINSTIGGRVLWPSVLGIAKLWNNELDHAFLENGAKLNSINLPSEPSPNFDIWPFNVLCS